MNPEQGGNPRPDDAPVIDMKKMLPPDEYKKWQAQYGEGKANAPRENAEASVRRLEREAQERKQDQARRAERDQREVAAGLVNQLAKTVRSQSPDGAGVFVKHALEGANIRTAADVQSVLDQKFGLYQDATLTGNPEELQSTNLDLVIPVGEKKFAVKVYLNDMGGKPNLNFEVAEQTAPAYEARALKPMRSSKPEPVPSTGVSGFFKRLFGRR